MKRLNAHLQSILVDYGSLSLGQVCVAPVLGRMASSHCTWPYILSWTSLRSLLYLIGRQPSFKGASTNQKVFFNVQWTLRGEGVLAWTLRSNFFNSYLLVI